MSSYIMTSHRSYGSSLCLQCSGLRFVLGRHEQCYRMCQHRAPRYPAQPQLTCPSFEGLERLSFTLSRGDSQRSGSLLWVGPSLLRGVSYSLESPMVMTDLFVEHQAALYERAAPASALLWITTQEGESGYLKWTMSPCKGALLAWSAQVISARAGDLLTLSR